MRNEGVRSQYVRVGILYYAYLHIIIVSLLPHIIIDYIVTYSFISSTRELVMEFLVLWDALGNIHRGISDTST